MTDADLTARLQELLCAAQRRYRTRRGWGALTTIPIPDQLIDEIAAGLAPLLRELVAAAVEERASFGGALAPVTDRDASVEGVAR